MKGEKNTIRLNIWLAQIFDICNTQKKKYTFVCDDGAAIRLHTSYPFPHPYSHSHALMLDSQMVLSHSKIHGQCHQTHDQMICFQV